jgi:putative ABC transport system ATP-binding protein
MLKLDGVGKSFGDMHLFQGLDLEISPGEHCLIQGSSGTGKTTLLNLIGRLDSPTSGACFFEGTPYEKMGAAAAFRLKNMGILFQDLHLIESLSVLQNLRLIQSASGAAVDPMAMLENFGVGHLSNQSVLTLSRGEAQRVAMARAFSNRPKILLADEPTSSLDPDNRDTVLNQLFRMCSQIGATAIVVSHSADVAKRDEFSHRLAIGPGEKGWIG